MIIFSILTLLILAFANSEKCCTSCQLPQVKYLSIDPNFNKCGETCMDPKYFWIYKKFEKWLELATSDTPCLDKNYSTYEKTVTHGVWPITATLDLYDLPTY